MKKLRAGLQILAALAVAAGAAVLAFVLLKTAPETTPEDQKQAVKIVQTIVLRPGDERVVVTAWGTVIPAREVTMRPQVEGRVIEQGASVVPGGRLAAGEELLRLDPADYEMALIERTAELEEAKYEFDIEKGRQVIAKREYEQLRRDLPAEDVDPSLALREPYLRRTEAMITKAENAIEKARLDLGRTVLHAPFNSMVIEEFVEVGQLVEAGDEVCRLVGTDTFWVRATLPMADLPHIRLPEREKSGAEAKVFLDTGHGDSKPWLGRVTRLLSDLEETGRMARLLVEIDDPLGLEESGKGRAPLLLGSYVRIDIEAGLLQGVLEIPRYALREGNRLWLVDRDNRIRIAEPEILWTRADTVLVPDVIEDGERLVVSELKAVLPGMEVNPQPLSADQSE